MKQIIALAALALAAGCSAASAEDQSLARADGEAKLATELRNYQPAGQPISCVSLRTLEGNRSAGENAVIFDGPGGRLYVNRPPAGCPVLRHGRALNVRTTSSQLCRGDIVSVFDPLNGTDYGSCGLGEFEPYQRRRS
jgi:hypothetical protein